MSGQRHSQDRRAEVRAALQLDSEPTDEFMTLLAELGEPLLSSTLLLPGQEVPFSDAHDIRDRLERRVDLVIDAGACDVVPSTVIDMTYTPDEIEDVVVNATTGELLARARGGRTLASIGEKVGVTRARIQQLERSTNIEIATFVRVAKACGYEVSVHLRPLHSGFPPLSAVLGAPDAP